MESNKYVMSLEFSIFKKYQELIYGISEKKDGPMKLFGNEAIDTVNIKNRQIYFANKKISAQDLILAEIVHGTGIQVITDADRGRIIHGIDALVARENNLIISITVADCFPVYFYDPLSKIIAISHAGWRGIIDGVIKNTVKTILTYNGFDLSKLLVGIGPGIQKCHFEIKEDILENFKEYQCSITRQDNKIFVDLSLIIYEQLRELNIPENNIEINKDCTFCEKEKYFSYRRDKPEVLEVMIAYIGIQ